MSKACYRQNPKDFGVTLVTGGNPPATLMTTMANAGRNGAIRASYLVFTPAQRHHDVRGHPIE